MHVVRAHAIKGQVVRLVFDEEPQHQGASGRYDALNPANYLLEVVTGQLYTAQIGVPAFIMCVGVDETIVTGPAVGVEAGDERGVDLHTDKPLMAAMRYRVTVVNVRSRLGGGIGAPYSAEFVGVVARKNAAPTRTKPFIDIGNSTIRGSWAIDSGGDLETDQDLENLRKRVLRRFMTPKGAFSWMPNYGCGIQLKEAASVGQLQQLRADLLNQIKQEPEVEAADVSLNLQAVGVLSVIAHIRTRSGATIEAASTRLADGTVVA